MPGMRAIADGHLDLAWNAIACERDQLLSLDALREKQADAAAWLGTPTVSLPALREAGVGLVVASLLARCKPEICASRKPARIDCDWPSPDMAHAVAHGQLAYYRLLDQRQQIRLVTNRGSLESCWNRWRRNHEGAPMGVVLTMEGADPIVEPEQLQTWVDAGLRGLGLAHFGPGRYAAGTPDSRRDPQESDGPITAAGRRLLQEMERLGVALDLTHLGQRSLKEALDRFGGRVYASHCNARALVDHPRQLDDDTVRTLVVRGGVIGVALFNGMIKRVDGRAAPREQVSLEDLADHVDHLREVTGGCRAIAIGSDLDGGFGREHTPREIDSVGDLHKLADVLTGRGYADEDLDAIFHGNWLRFWTEVLPPRDGASL